MNQKLFSAIFLISGTAIGAGLLALPLVLARIGFLPLILVLCATWGLMYLISLMGIELAIRKTKSFSLGGVGVLSFIILFYALLSAYLDGSASIVQTVFMELFQVTFSTRVTTVFCFSLLVLTLSSMFTIIEKINSILLIMLVAVVGFLVTAILIKTPVTAIPMIEEQANGLGAWALIIPLVFTSFGFNAVIEPITTLLDRKPKLIKKAFFWGSLIPLGVYLVWTLGILYVMHGSRPDVYTMMVQGGADLGLLVQALSEMSDYGLVQILMWSMSLLSIFTSALGIGISLIYLFETYFLSITAHSERKSHSAIGYFGHLLRVVGLTAPALLITLFIPDAFIKILAFAGMILVVNAVLIPLYEVFVSHSGRLNFSPILNRKWVLYGLFMIALCIMGCEVYNLFT